MRQELRFCKRAFSTWIGSRCLANCPSQSWWWETRPGSQIPLLAALGSSNLPKKSNFQKHVGLDALTGKSNFDISEWMIIKLLEALNGRRATLAMLCKTAVARKALVHAWKSVISLSDVEIHSIDAATQFDVAVDACLLTCRLLPSSHQEDCRVYRRLGDAEPGAVIGYRDNELVADLLAFSRWKHLGGREIYKWRSGVKHDCSKVMELWKEGHRYRNGLGEVFELESDYVYPMLKSSNLTTSCSDEPQPLDAGDTKGRWGRDVDDTSHGAQDLGVSEAAWRITRPAGKLDLPGPSSLLGVRRWRLHIFAVEGGHLWIL